ncbi:hypothetical protein QE152_g36699 [Popillia japonica]|uniref:Uncharacterized protein n=1 Tax=Popillia japonica TaxID=7064 RepID=A0AAW1ICY4_POPJA
MSEKQHAIPKHALQLVFSRKPERRQNETQRNIEPIEIMLRATAVEFTHNHTYIILGRGVWRQFTGVYIPQSREKIVYFDGEAKNFLMDFPKQKTCLNRTGIETG